MTYTDKQIENAKRNYNSFLKIETLADYDVENNVYLIHKRKTKRILGWEF